MVESAEVASVRSARTGSIPRVAAIALALAFPLATVAFWPFYLSRPFAKIDVYTHLHAVTGTLWLLLLLVQVIAVETRCFGWHRRLGRTSYVLAPLFVLSAALLSHFRLASMDEAKFAAEGSSAFLPFYAGVIFAAAFTCALVFVRDRAAHGRFMLLTAIPMIDPVLGRVMFFHLPPLPSPWLYQTVTFAIATAIAAALVFSYRRQGAAQHALRGYFVLLVVLELGWFFFSPTAAWLGLVRWYRALPLTGVG
jgi:hypothetical protein